MVNVLASAAAVPRAGAEGGARRPHRGGREQGGDHQLRAQRGDRLRRAPAAPAGDGGPSARGARAADSRAAGGGQGAAAEGARYGHPGRRRPARPRGPAHRRKQQDDARRFPQHARARQRPVRRLAGGPAGPNPGIAPARARGRGQDPGERQRDRPLPRGAQGQPRALGIQRVAHPGARTGRGQPRAHRGGARPGAEGACRGTRERRFRPGGGGLFRRPGRARGRQPRLARRSAAGFHLVKLNERRDASGSSAPVTQTRARHILVRTSEVVSENEARRRLNDMRERIVNGTADFAELAKANSDDTGSAARGGELDWIYPGDTVPDFERALQELKPGEISQPVKTPFGYHLIQVLERRSSDVSQERRRLEARKVLRERKSEDAYQDWLRQLRDQAYVELRLEER